ncbi:MAG: glycosyltransferase family 39 protein [Steroidobacteraceae bacterium]|jgi:4-amino-4-deoxy-L-arabinose transferase-like glycosyltransferase
MLDDRHKRLLVAAAFVFTILWFAMLVGRPLYDPDEGRYAEIPREILSGGDWVIPHLDGFVYLEKPPLQYWATALLFAAVGEAEWSARLYTGVAGYLSLVLVFAIGYRLWGFNAGLKALLLAAGSILFILLGHQLTLDMSLSFWLLASLACFVFAQSSRERPPATRGWMLGCWAAMALAVLTKGLIGVVIPGFTLVAYVLWQRDRRMLSQLNFRYGIPVFAAIAVPWFALAARANPEFLQFFFIREHFQRFLTPIEARSEPWWFFIPVLIVGVLPWITQALRALAIGWRGAQPAGDFNARRLLWIWSAFVLVFFSFSDSKLIPYILPCVPTLALLCAEPMQGDERKHLLAGTALTLLFAAGTLVYASAIWSSAHGRALAVELRPALLWVSLALGAAAAAAFVLTSRRRFLGASAALGAGWFGAALAITVGACDVQQFFSAKDIAATLRRVAPAGAAIFSVQTYEQSLPFYLGRELTLVDYRDEFALGLRQDPGRAIAGTEEFARAWTALPAGFAIMPPASRERLAAQGLPMRELARFADRIVLVSRQ